MNRATSVTRTAFTSAWCVTRVHMGSGGRYNTSAPEGSAEYAAMLCHLTRYVSRMAEDPASPTPAQLATTHRHMRRRVFDARHMAAALRRRHTRRRGALP